MRNHYELIESKRRSLGITKQAVAQKLHISWAAADSKLSGRTEFDLSEAITIADWWGMTVDELVGHHVERVRV